MQKTVIVFNGEAFQLDELVFPFRRHVNQPIKKMATNSICFLVYIALNYDNTSLSEPHTSLTTLYTYMCILACLLACLLAAIYCKF